MNIGKRLCEDRFGGFGFHCEGMYHICGFRSLVGRRIFGENKSQCSDVGRICFCL